MLHMTTIFNYYLRYEMYRYIYTMDSLLLREFYCNSYCNFFVNVKILLRG